MQDSNLQRALEQVDALQARFAPYEEVLRALNECASLPDSASVMAGIWQRRIGALRRYARPEEECARVLDEYLARDEPLPWRASAVAGCCADHPELTRRYLLPIIAELESASSTDPVLDRMLTDLRIARDRTLGPSPK